MTKENKELTTRIVGINGVRFPEKQIDHLNQNYRKFIKVEDYTGPDGEKHTIRFRLIRKLGGKFSEDSGIFIFDVDNSEMQSCYGHPMVNPQGNGIPSAVDIFIQKGKKSTFKTWVNHFKNNR